MPLTRLVKSDTLLSSSWHVALLVRLPPELRQLAIQDLLAHNFSTSALAWRTKRSDDPPPFSDEYEDHVDLSGLTSTREHEVSLQTGLKTQERSHVKQQPDTSAPSQKNSSALPENTKAKKSNADSWWRRLPFTSRDGTEHRGKPVSRRFQYMMENTPGRGARISKHLSVKGHAKPSWRSVETQAKSGMAKRLAILKERIIDSPGDISDAPEIREQLLELEAAFRQSLESKGGQISSSGNAALVATKHEQYQIGRPIHDPVADSHQYKAQKASTTVPREKVKEIGTSEKPSGEQDQAPISTPSSSGSEIANLKAQIQELTSLVRSLMAPNNAAKPSPSEVSSFGHEATINTPPKFANLPHELDSEPFTSNLDATPETEQEVGLNTVARRYRGSNRDDKQDVLFPKPGDPKSEEESQVDGTRSNQEEDKRTISSKAATVKGEIPSNTLDSTTLDDLGCLYDELFPDMNSAASRVGADSSHTDIPRLELPRSTGPELEPVKPRGAARSALARTKDGRGVKPVLVLRYASKTLTEDDFRRAMPRGEHIKEWMHNGEFEKVIPTRNPYTLERTGDYWIIFKTRRMADAFLAHVKKVHTLSRQRPPRTLLSPLPQAPNLIGPAIATETELLKDFTLVPPSMPLWLEKELNGVAYKVLHRGGYPQVLAGGLGPETPQVLLETQGGHTPNWYQVHDAIENDGRMRNMAWELQPGDLGIRKVEMGKPSIKDINEEIAHDSHGVDEDDNLGHDENDILTAEDKVRKPKHGQRWIIAFKDKDEASRFARTWHKRLFPWPEDAGAKKLDHHLERTMVNAELLW